MTKWQKIETAPKDGTLILLACDWGGVVIGGFFSGQWQFADINPLAQLLVERGHWREGYGPTNWQPLPPPPEGEDE